MARCGCDFGFGCGALAAANDADARGTMLRSGVVCAAGILDPVTQTLTNFEDEDDLNAKIDDIYAVSHVISGLRSRAACGARRGVSES